MATEPQFYNSLSKKVEPLEPKEPGKVRIYNCGPTVYKRQHIGNMRRFLFADFLRRTLELLGYEVRDITNITDVGHLTEDDIDAGEDKIEKEAKAKQTSPQAIIDEQLRNFQSDIAALNIEPAHLYPKATQHIPQMQQMITTLIEKGLAYQTPTGVYFDVQAFPEYGKLSGNTLANIEAGARVEVREEKKHPADFALWVVDPKHLQKWDSPWGVGYPGWHIECSAMSLEYLGNDIDIHTGGEDNKFPHHENEIAQSEGATGSRLARLWMHNRHLQFQGKKLAKREGEQITIDTLREKDYSPLALRLMVFGAHYRTKMDFSWETLDEFAKHIQTVRTLLRRMREISPQPEPGAIDEKVIQAFKQVLADDLNTPEALALFLEYITTAHALLDGAPTPKSVSTIRATLAELDKVVGIITQLEAELDEETVPAEILDLAQQREQARKDKNFEKADELRSALEAQGYTVEDTPFGPRVLKK